ncbi:MULTISPECIES: hypothetical protein [unclassified Streptomyces]|uniref:hypothetical protein n=1 Tax=unclassified Streptomyces TaxID=2593676 RepID=UPI0027DA693B|nr:MULTISPECIES: hypothetical protein [unclassified Streptomyces]
MDTQLRDVAQGLARLLWREHTVYRERSGGVVIRGEHVRRWISLAPSGGRDEVLVRAGRILDGGTTAPARSEAVVSLSAGTTVLAATCRRLLAEAAADALGAAGGETSGGSERPRKSRRNRKDRKDRGPHDTAPARGRKGRARKERHTGFSSWVILLSVVGLVGLYAYSVAQHA